jgi:hypothetical protein
LGVAAERRQIGEGAAIRLLQNVLRLAVVAYDAARDPKQSLIMTLDEQPDGMTILQAGTRQQFGIIGNARPWRQRGHNPIEPLHSSPVQMPAAPKGSRRKQVTQGTSFSASLRYPRRNRPR